MRDRLIALLKQLALHHEPCAISAEMLADAAHLPVDIVLRTLGAPENYPALVAYDQPNITRERILAAAMHVFAQKGWQKTSLDEIAAAAGLTKGAIYWHFRNKNDLFFALLDARLQRDTSPVPDEICQAIEQAGQGRPVEAIAELLGSAWSRCAGDREWLRLFLEVMSQAREPEMAQRLQALYEHIWQMSADFVRAMQAGGVTRADIPPQTLAKLWCALFDGVMFAAMANPQLNVGQLARDLMPILWQGIAPTPTSEAVS